jgi:hypothetical protein
MVMIIRAFFIKSAEILCVRWEENPLSRGRKILGPAGGSASVQREEDPPSGGRKILRPVGRNASIRWEELSLSGGLDAVPPRPEERLPESERR